MSFTTRWRPWLRRFLTEWVKPVLVIVIVVGSIRSAVADWNDVPTGSMRPTILEGDRIFVNKLAYDLKLPFTRWRLFEWEGPARGDVVVFFSPDEDIRMVKRIVGLPGDVLELRHNRLWVNGTPASYGALAPSIVDDLDAASRRRSRFALEVIGDGAHPIALIPGRGMRTSFARITVPAGYYFAMGDNRDNSRDSRWFGFVPRKSIMGRSTHVAVSFNPDRAYLPRWSRFFQRLP